jgi:hypothetical protein
MTGILDDERRLAGDPSPPRAGMAVPGQIDPTLPIPLKYAYIILSGGKPRKKRNQKAVCCF